MPTNDEDVKLHLQEADDLKKQWFNYVFESIQKLNEKIEATTLQLQKEKEELIKLMIMHRDKLLEVIKETDVKNKEDLDKLTRQIQKIIDAIKNKLGELTSENADLKLLIETELNSLKEDFRDNLEKTLRQHIQSDAERFKAIEDDVKTIQSTQTVLKTKVGVYALIISLIITTFITAMAGGFLVLFKDAIKAWLGA